MTRCADNFTMTESDETTFWDRLGEAMLENKLKHTQTAASALIGSKGNTAARKWQEGGYPNMTNTVHISKQLGVCVEWLLTGRGAMYPLTGARSKTQRRLLKMWSFMKPNAKREVFSKAVEARLMPNLIGIPNLTQEEFEAEVERLYSQIPSRERDDDES